MSAKLTTPWGEASLIERVTLPQRAGEKRFSSVVELLEGSRGERLVRFAYSTDGVARRGPVTLRAATSSACTPHSSRHPSSPTRSGSPEAARERWWCLDGRRERQPSRVDQRAEDQRAVGRPEQRLDRVLRVGHQPEDVALLVADARHVCRSTRSGSRPSRVAQHELAVRFELGRAARRRRTSSRRRA